MNPAEEFEARRADAIARQGQDDALLDKSRDWMNATASYQYTYHFSWMGRPVIQFPQDLIAMQEIIWRVRPDLIVETGIAHGGSLVFSASMLQLLGGDGIVVGVDIDIRPHNRAAIEAHPMAPRIRMIEGSSTDPQIVEQVFELARGRQRVLVALDSDHTHEHVLRELQAYSPLVRKGSYLVVFDTTIDEAPDGLFANREWGARNNPKTAVLEFLRTNDRFEIDREIAAKLLITVARDGWLKCLRD